MLRTQSTARSIPRAFCIASKLRQLSFLMCFRCEAMRKYGIMKAVRFHSYGDSGVLVCEDMARPVAGPGQVVVKVAGAAFNPLDVAIRAGYVHEVFPVALPHVPNYD